MGLLVYFKYKKVLFLANLKPFHTKSEINKPQVEGKLKQTIQLRCHSELLEEEKQNK